VSHKPTGLSAGLGQLHANASHHANLDYDQLAREILKEAAAVNAAEDEHYGDARALPMLRRDAWSDRSPAASASVSTAQSWWRLHGEPGRRLRAGSEARQLVVADIRQQQL
jgi:hypothetical protein